MNIDKFQIVFTGTHGTGKTTLAEATYEYIEKEWSDVNWKDKRKGPRLLTDSSRVVLRKQKRLIDIDQALMSWEIFNLRRSLFSSHKMFISDRSLIDPIGYAVVNNLDKDKIRIMENMTITTSMSHDVIFYVPIMYLLKDIEKDIERPVGEEYRKKVDIIIRNFIQKYKIPTVILSSPDHNSRMEMIKTSLNAIRSAVAIDEED